MDLKYCLAQNYKVFNKQRQIPKLGSLSTDVLGLTGELSQA